MRKLLFILLFVCCVFSTAAAQDMRTLFMDAPDEVLPLLPRNARADCIDLVDAGMSYPVTNLLGGKSMLKVLTNDYLLLQSTGSSVVEMKLLPFKGGFIICVVKSVSAEATDSRIAFYDKSWRLLDASQFFTAPSIRDFFTTPDSKILDICDMYLVSLKLNEADNYVVAEYTMPNYMNNDDAEKVRSLLKNITYRWSGSGFVKE